MDTTKKVIVGGVVLAVAGLAAYIIWKMNQPAAAAALPAASAPTGTAAAATTPVTTVATATSGGTPVEASTSVDTVDTAPAAGSGYFAGNGNIPVPQYIVDWANTLSAGNKAQFFKQLPNMQQSDLDGLADIYNNDWQGNHVTTAAQTAFWNKWRTSYHILDGTYP